ncbi:MAG: ATP-dependent DNA helicase RecG [Sedimentisphaerales bacterium]|nr:ATP-dependent DNA helicase RecG [Sedimentisphaerales bacterium]
MSSAAKPSLGRETQIRFLKGVGPRRAALLEQLGLCRARDLLEYYPRGYEFIPPVRDLADLLADQPATVVGEVADLRYIGRSRPPRLEVRLRDETGDCRLVWFHGGFLRNAFLPGDRIAAWGKTSRYQETVQLVNPQWRRVEDRREMIDQQAAGRAIYPAMGQLRSGEIARILHDNLDALLDLTQERFDAEYRRQRQIPARQEALRWIHCPADDEQLARARRRLKYDELFLMELGIALRREKLQRGRTAYRLEMDAKLDERIRRRFPFSLTPDQDKVIAEICGDLARERPMNRLCQGDVGSGKTVVALYAALAAIGRGLQVAIMAPTEILAEQHFLGIERYLQYSRVRRCLLVGGLTGGRRRRQLEEIRTGQIDIVVGTQALLQQDVEFQQLALVVVDEQHKFGVRQRQRIRSKGRSADGGQLDPHCLVMTATPIPRTLALTVFGDLEISTIEHLPPGRRQITTRWVPPEARDSAYAFIRDKVRQGEQAYFVYPRLEESCPNPADGEVLKSAVTEQRHLQNEVFSELRVALLHGQMPRPDKQQIMEDFRRRRIDILVATVVIEVGIDVPNATIMVIEHADRFGLAQLHQLRGRIGRGQRPSYCLLFAGDASEIARQRLEIMTETQNGFRIAEEDLRLRGPGEFFGTAQHGLPNLKIANLIEDMDLLQMARRDAFGLAKKDHDLQAPEHQPLRRALQEQFGDDLILGDVG